ncbi:MAG: GIY-YIG nuclease family protein [Candidatus Woesebacteria bacterium]|nr:GIY-YIG nuclease family protein [Candidatus Woesebacteria bacterium]
MAFHYTYVLSCKNSKTNKRKFYVGSTSDLKGRVEVHKSKSVNTTKIFDIIELVYYEACRNKTDARKRELQLKTGFGRGYLKRRLINDIEIGGCS